MSGFLDLSTQPPPEPMEILALLIAVALLGLIPANIAKNKGYDFATWWLYGALLIIVALPHAMALDDKN